MRYTINLHGAPSCPANVKAEAGVVCFNGLKLLPFEAAMLGDALNECAERAEEVAAQVAASSRPTLG